MQEKAINFEFCLTKQAGVSNNISCRAEVVVRIDPVQYGCGVPYWDYKLINLVTRKGYRLQARRLSPWNRHRLREAVKDRICDELIYYR